MGLLQLGILLQDTIVDHIMADSPAAKSLHPGDKIVNVDGEQVNQGNILQLLIGSDIPGSSVRLTISRNKGQVRFARKTFIKKHVMSKNVYSGPGSRRTVNQVGFK